MLQITTGPVVEEIAKISRRFWIKDAINDKCDTYKKLDYFKNENVCFFIKTITSNSFSTKMSRTDFLDELQQGS